MSTGLTQIISVGAQDVHITGDPQVTFFKSNYKRHSRFGMFTTDQVINGNPKPGGMSTIKIEKRGDLLSYVFINATNGNKSLLINNWQDIIDYSELVIGGQVIDTQDSFFTENIAIELFAQTLTRSSLGGGHNGGLNASYFYPFRFFFCESWQHSLPLYLMNNSTIEINIYWKDTLPTNLLFEASAHYVLLSDEEKISNTKSDKVDMLIFQVQKSQPSGEKVQNLDFTQMVKYIASANVTANSLISETSKIRLEANGNEISEMKFSLPYYSIVKSYYHTDYSYGNENTLFLMPFCISTSKVQPTGTMNFSRLDSFKITCTEPITEPIYAVNYNIIRFQNGMCGILYAN